MKKNTRLNKPGRESLKFRAVIARTTTDTLKVKVGAPGSAHEVTLEVWGLEIEDLLNLADNELEVGVRTV